ncbi:MAG: putative cell division FtsK/SpoIIIE [Berkelbacteria bacterium GW2011_GWE1_39_12]|uniref:Putative cell division FtsK/SpoIIIE n=1 Tax=Berkelbacteria bacterium GW2011_GWE1_39_12 TaxID=1618337 RepID=A0A0G4B5Q1_9BACT|nr:MAG: putative cell division FtsK/SpoIIIE [Berkelbacteria bacterium GW2011_GWE1_39_12]
MAKRKYRRKGQRLSVWEEMDWSVQPETAKSVTSVILIILGLIILLGIFGLAGVTGKFFLRLSTDLWGLLGYLIPFIFLTYGVGLLIKSERFQIKPMTVVGTVLLMIFLPALIHPVGGAIGGGIRSLFVAMVGFYASLILLFGLTIVGLLVTMNTSIVDLWQRIKPESGGEASGGGVRVNENGARASVFTLPNRQAPQPHSSMIQPFQGGDKTWNFPPLDLLETGSGKATSGNIPKNVDIIQKTLSDFGVPVAMGDVNVGPTVTQYTLKPGTSVKLNQITARANDLSLALAQHPIRIEAPIPGKSAVGIEIPNKTFATVSLREVLESEECKASKSNLTLAIGRDVAGQAVAADLKQMPHLLIAGATGSGKSVGINAMILSLLYQNSPNDLRLILVDPKRVEFTHYNDVPHLLCPVVFDVDKTVSALRWAVAEMDRRFRVLQETGRRNIEAYNQNPPNGKLPYIVIFIDELADLMAQAGNEVESAIVRLAQMARAVGIHLVVATQRPSVDVITGLIKANITNRIAFAVASQIDSRTILDASGAEKLLGKGDMLWLGNDLGKPKRIQGVLITDKEVDKITNFLKNESAPQYDETILSYHTPSQGGVGGGGDMSSSDDLYNEAKEVVVMAGKASASLLQRRLRVGYARAARLLDMLESEGIIGPADGAKPRDVMIDPVALEHERNQASMPMNQAPQAHFAPTPSGFSRPTSPEPQYTQEPALPQAPQYPADGPDEFTINGGTENDVDNFGR